MTLCLDGERVDDVPADASKATRFKKLFVFNKLTIVPDF
jgi:hypothetical protein